MKTLLLAATPRLDELIFLYKFLQTKDIPSEVMIFDNDTLTVANNFDITVERFEGEKRFAITQKIGGFKATCGCKKMENVAIYLNMYLDGNWD